MTPDAVVDASAWVEWLLQTPRGRSVESWMGNRSLHTPELAVVEISHALAGIERGETVSRERIREVHTLAVHLPAVVWPHEPLIPRAWELRSNLSLYDATYVSLAEALALPLVTCDLRLARGASAVARIDIVGLG